MNYLRRFVAWIKSFFVKGEPPTVMPTPEVIDAAIWREVGPDEVLEPGQFIKMSMATGKSYVRRRVLERPAYMGRAEPERDDSGDVILAAAIVDSLLADRSSPRSDSDNNFGESIAGSFTAGGGNMGGAGASSSFDDGGSSSSSDSSSSGGTDS